MHRAAVPSAVPRILVGPTVVVAVALVISGCGEDGRATGTPATPAETPAATDARAATGRGISRRPRGCPVTPPNGEIPPGQEHNPGADSAAYYGNGRLWTILYDKGILRRAPRRDGSIREKFPWWRAVRGRLRITGRRLDRHARPLRAHIPDGYGATGFQSTGLIFPSEGCWRVTGTAGPATLTFVTLVVKATGQ